MISLLLLRAMFSWEEYSHGKHRLLDMCRYMFVCYKTFPGAIPNISWEISGTIPGICCMVHCPIFLHASSAVDISQVHFHEMTLSPLVLIRLLSSSKLSIVAAYPAVS